MLKGVTRWTSTTLLVVSLLFGIVSQLTPSTAFPEAVAGEEAAVETITLLEIRRDLLRTESRDGEVKYQRTKVPVQLNTTAFSTCLSVESAAYPPDLDATKERYDLSSTDGLLLYLSLYAGKRVPLLNATQELAFKRWSDAFDAETETLATWLRDALTGALTPSSRNEAEQDQVLVPGELFGEAWNICGANSTAHFCAALISHNTLRLIGRNSTYVDSRGKDYRPDWYLSDLDTWHAVMQDFQEAAITLRRDGGGDGDRFGSWYHSAGLIAYGLHEAAVLGLRSGDDVTKAVAYLNRLLNPIFAGGKEDPVKAQIDIDSADVAGFYAVGGQEEGREDPWRNGFQGRAPPQYCSDSRGYVLPPSTF